MKLQRAQALYLGWVLALSILTAVWVKYNFQTYLPEQERMINVFTQTSN